MCSSLIFLKLAASGYDFLRDIYLLWNSHVEIKYENDKFINFTWHTSEILGRTSVRIIVIPMKDTHCVGHIDLLSAVK